MAGTEAVIKLRATGGSDVQSQIDKVRTSLEKAKKTSFESSEGFKKISNSFENLATEAVGLNGPLGQLGEGLIAFGPSGVATVAVLAGVTIMIGVMNKLKETSKATETANNDLARSFAELAGKSEEFDYQKALNRLSFAVDAVNTFRSRGKVGQTLTNLVFGNPEEEYRTALAAVNRFGQQIVQKREAAAKEEEAKHKERETKYKAHTDVLRKAEEQRLKDLVDKTKFTYDQLYAFESLKARSPEKLNAERASKELANQKALDAAAAAEVNRMLDQSIRGKPRTSNDILGNQTLKIDYTGIVANVQKGLENLRAQLGGGPLFGQFAGLAASMETAIGDNFGAAIYNGFARAIEMGNPIELIRGFGSVLTGAIGQSINEMAMTWLGGIGKMFARQAAAYLKFGNIMKVASKFLTNPFTAGVAAVAIGAGLMAISRSLGAQAASSVSGGASLGFGNEFSQSATNVSNNGKGDATITIVGGILDTSNPEQMRSLADAIGYLGNTRVSILRG